MHDPHAAFQQHFHDVIQNAKSADTEESSKAPVRIKPATFLVAYYHENEPQVEGTIECDSIVEALDLQKQISEDGTKTKVFLTLDLAISERLLLDHHRALTHVNETTRKEQAQAQSDHEG